MKKLMLIAETCMDGVGKHVSDLVRCLDKTKYDIIVVHGTKRMDYYFKEMMKEVEGQVTFEPVPSMSRNIHPVKDLRAFIHINGLMNRYRPNIVHCHSSKAGVLGRVLAIRKPFVKKIYYTPHAYAIQNMDLDSKLFWLFLDLEKWLANNDKVTTINVSEGERNFAKYHGIIEDKAVVIYNAIEDEKGISEDSKRIIRAELGMESKDRMVACVARLYHQKNPQLFMSIAREITALRQDIHFIWIGEGEMMVEMQRESHKNPQIHFVGHRTDIHKLLCSADLFLSTAIYEGLPYTLIEACRAGLPIAASNITGNNELVVDGVNGRLYDLEKESEQTPGQKEVLELLDNPQELGKMGVRAREIFENRFDIQQMIQALERLYDE